MTPTILQAIQDLAMAIAESGGRVTGTSVMLSASAYDALCAEVDGKVMGGVSKRGMAVVINTSHGEVVVNGRE